MTRSPKGHVNIRVLTSGSKAHEKGDSRNHGSGLYGPLSEGAEPD